MLRPKLLESISKDVYRRAVFAFGKSCHITIFFFFLGGGGVDIFIFIYTTYINYNTYLHYTTYSYK